MSKTTDPTPFQLNDGRQLPAVGLGTFGMTGETGIATLVTGLDNGYRLLDTASGYRNEPEVAAALRETSIPRAQISVTSKLRGPDHARARKAIRESRERLGGDPIDLFLIHWPNPRKGLFVDAWRALIDARAEGDVRSIGVSNFEESHLEAIINATGVVPAVNQIELHPHFNQPKLRALHTNLGICTQSWSPLGIKQALSEPSIMSIASEHHVSPARAVLRWHHQLGCLPIPRSSNMQRQAENLDIGDFCLSEDQMHRISELGRPDAPRFGRLWGGDPATQEL